MSMTVVSGLKMYTRKGGPAYFPRIRRRHSVLHPPKGSKRFLGSYLALPGSHGHLPLHRPSAIEDSSPGAGRMRYIYGKVLDEGGLPPFGLGSPKDFPVTPSGLALPGHAISQKNWKVPGSLIAWSTEKDPEGERVPEIPVRFNARQRDD